MWVFVTIGGATGALARYWLSGWIQGVSGGVFPLGTLVVNVVGCLLLGFGMQGMEALPVSAALRTMLTIGFLGAFTTFSTFSYETVTLLRDGDWTRAALYTAMSVGLGLAAVIAGMVVASALLTTRG
jgi:CrcB protein